MLCNESLAILPKLRKGDMVRINDREFTIREKSIHKASEKMRLDVIRYELGDNFVLEYDWQWRFFECVARKAKQGVIETDANCFDIKTLEVNP